MCGIVGAAGLVFNKEEKIVKELLVVDSLRGVDSTGVAVIPRNGDVKVAKAVGNTFELLDDNRTNIAFNGMHRAIIGHNRFGTMGKATKANAHPFNNDTVVGVHNGTLLNKWKLANGNDFTNDSAALYNHIDKHGIKDALKELDGAWALVWWDKVAEELNFLRNKERPLYLTYSKDGKSLFWASEYWMLEGILWRNDVSHGEVTELPVDTLMTVAITNTGELNKPHLLASPSLYKPPVKQSRSITYHNSSPPANTKNSQLPDIKSKLTIVPKEGGSEKKSGVVPETANPTQPMTYFSSSSLQNAKTVSLEILSHCENDGWGGSYLSCYDENHKFATIRWYYPRNVDPEAYIGEFIICDIGQRIDRGQDKSYYKVVSSSVVLLDDEEDVEKGKENLYEDARGKLISETDWLAKHGECRWCSDLIRPTDRHAFSSAFQCFCGSCMDNREVQSYAKFTTLVN